MMKVGITGATGFLGRHVLSDLNVRDVDVVAATRPGRRELPDLARGRWVPLDLCSPPVNTFELMGKPDVLIHLAWEGLPNYGSLHHIETELPRQYAFLRDAIANGLESLVVTGTCFEYGMKSGQLSESTETRPHNPYGFAKDTLRRQLEFLRQTKGFQLTWARLFYTYGDGQAESSLWSQLKRAAEKGDSSFDMSGGEQLRDFLPVSQMAKCLVDLALCRQDIGVVNVCSGTPISVRRLVEGWIQDNNWTIDLNLGHFPYPDHEPMAFWGDCRKLIACSQRLERRYGD